MPTMYSLSDLTQPRNNSDLLQKGKKSQYFRNMQEYGVNKMGRGLVLPWRNQSSQNKPYTVYANQPIADVLGIK